MPPDAVCVTITRLILARPLPGTVGESRRIVHVFPEQAGDNLTAYCGTTFAASDMETLAAVCGMPCERCLARMPRNSAAIGS